MYTVTAENSAGKAQLSFNLRVVGESHTGTRYMYGLAMPPLLLISKESCSWDNLLFIHSHTKWIVSLMGLTCLDELTYCESAQGIG